MRRIELETELPAGADEAWRVFIDTDAWPSWGRLVVAARGEMRVGARWEIELRPEKAGPPRRMRPTLVALAPPRLLQFETRIGGRWAVRMVHTFEFSALDPNRSLLRQSFGISGLLIRPLWAVLRQGAEQFGELGDDLARRLGDD